MFALLRYGDAEDSNGLHGHDAFGGTLQFCKAHFSVSQGSHTGGWGKGQGAPQGGQERSGGWRRVGWIEEREIKTEGAEWVVFVALWMREQMKDAKG